MTRLTAKMLAIRARMQMQGAPRMLVINNFDGTATVFAYLGPLGVCDPPPGALPIGTVIDPWPEVEEAEPLADTHHPGSGPASSPSAVTEVDSRHPLDPDPAVRPQPSAHGIGGKRRARYRKPPGAGS